MLNQNRNIEKDILAMKTEGNLSPSLETDLSWVLKDSNEGAYKK
jgi:hypothetical protein